MNPEDFLLLVLASRLTPLQVDVLVDLTLHEVSTRQLATKYGVSQQAVGRVATRARRKVSKTLLAAA